MADLRERVVAELMSGRRGIAAATVAERRTAAVRLLAAGLSPRQVADRMGVDVRTVTRYRAAGGGS